MTAGRPTCGLASSRHRDEILDLGRPRLDTVGLRPPLHNADEGGVDQGALQLDGVDARGRLRSSGWGRQSSDWGSKTRAVGKKSPSPILIFVCFQRGQLGNGPFAETTCGVDVLIPVPWGVPFHISSLVSKFDCGDPKIPKPVRDIGAPNQTISALRCG